MNHTNKITERRIHRRFEVQEGAYAALNNGSLKVGQIKNISKGGLAFRYLDDGTPTEGSYKAYLFLTDNDFFLQNLPFNTVSDFQVDSETPSNALFKKQCGGQFGDLTPDQMFRLDCFINDFALCEA
jgi:hypothetical protein